MSAIWKIGRRLRVDLSLWASRLRQPKAEIRPDLLDYLVRAKQQRLRNRQPERLRGLKVDHELESRRLLNGKVGGLGALQDSVDKTAWASVIT